VAIEKLYTAEEFEAFLDRPENKDKRFELIHGEIIPKMPTQLHALIVMLLGHALMLYLTEHPLGWVFPEARYGLPDDDSNDRVPDLSFVREELGPVIESGPAPYMPDLAVEVQSPDDNPKDMREKADYYIANGSRMVWLIFTTKRSRRVEVFRPDQPMQTIGIDDMLDGGDVLPGFKVAVTALFVLKAGGKE